MARVVTLILRHNYDAPLHWIVVAEIKVEQTQRHRRRAQASSSVNVTHIPKSLSEQLNHSRNEALCFSRWINTHVYSTCL